MMECPVQCGRNAHTAPDAVGSVLWGLGSFPNKQKIAFVSRKPCLQKSDTCEKSAFFIYS